MYIQYFKKKFFYSFWHNKAEYFCIGCHATRSNNQLEIVKRVLGISVSMPESRNSDGIDLPDNAEKYPVFSQRY